MFKEIREFEVIKCKEDELYLNIGEMYDEVDQIFKAAKILEIDLEEVLERYQGVYKSMYDYAKEVVKHSDYMHWMHHKTVTETIDYELLAKNLKSRFDIVHIDGLGLVFSKEV